MRIVAGSLKGRVLLEFSKIGFRPTSDMCRESLFNILQNRIYGVKFLDLFAGTGAVGIEAYSRGAEKVVLNDSSRESINLIKKNLDKLGITDKIKVLSQDAISLIKTTSEKYDIIFIDPPYASDFEQDVLSNISNAMEENGLAVYETDKPFTGQTYGLKIVDQRRYGKAHLTFFEKGE